MSEMIRADVLAALEAVAQAKNQTINELLEAWLAEHTARQADTDNPANYPLGSAARLAAVARRSSPLPPPTTDEVVSENADDILRNEYADYLLKRMERPVDEVDTHG